MVLEVNEKWVDAPGTRVSHGRKEAELLQVKVEREFSPDHTLNLIICKTIPGKEGISSKLLPLVVTMWEKKGEERYTDIYSFDHNGLCLSHGYSRYKNEEIIADEQHDNDISRLVENGGVIKELLIEYPLPWPLTMHPTVHDLKYGDLKK